MNWNEAELFKNRFLKRYKWIILPQYFIKVDTNFDTIKLVLNRIPLRMQGLTDLSKKLCILF
jgi:hypothetical protein